VPDRIPLNVLLGVPDYARGVVRVAPDGSHLRVEGNRDQRSLHMAKGLLSVDPNGDERISLRGSLNLVPFLSRERFAIRRFYLQKSAALRMRIGRGAILNQIADPDICPGALSVATRLVSEISRPCFNPPAAVSRTSRDGAAAMLTGIAGLRVPKTLRVRAPTPARVRDAIAQGGLEYPVLLRGIGSHGGVSLTKADGPEGVDDFPWSPGGDWGLYVTEFRDFKGSDGRYRKFRIVVIGDEILLRHCIIGDQWLLHAGTRASGTEEGERAMFDVFDRQWAVPLRPVFREMSARLGLDLYGVDCNIDDDGQVLVFEANACMNILKNTSPSPNMWDAPIARIKSAVEERLASPSLWYRAAS